MDRHAGEHPRIGAVDVIPFVPLGTTTMEDCVALARAFGARVASRFDVPVFLYANAASRSDRVKLADVRRGQYEGPEARDPDARPCSGLRAGPDASVGGGRRGRSPAVPHRLQHQSRLERRRPRQADRPPDPRIGRRPPEGPGERLLDRRARPRPGLDERPRFRRHAAVARVGDRPRRRRGGRRRAARVGAHRARAAGRVPRGRRPSRRRARRPGRTPSGRCGRVPSSCATSR